MADRVNPFEISVRRALEPKKVVEWRDTAGFENAESWEVSRQMGDMEFRTSGNFERQYQEDPIFLPIFTSIIGGGGFTLFGATVTYAGIASAIATTALVAGISYLLSPKPPKPEDARHPLTQAIPARFWIVGEVRTAGALMLWESKGETLHSIQALAGHEIDGFVRFYLSDDRITRTGSSVDYIGDRYGGGHVQIVERAGSVPGIPIAGAVAALSAEGSWTNDHRGDGQAYVYMACIATSQKKFLAKFPQGRPTLTAHVRGARLWDPRDVAQDPDDPTTWVFSKNSVLCLLWHECFNPFGTKRDYTRAILPVIDMWMEEADVCDEDVAKASGGTEKRYECNGFDSAERDPKAGTNAILATMDGWMADRGDGALLIVAGKVREKYIVEITDSDILGRDISNDVLFDEEVNRVIAKFTYPDTDFTTSDVDYWQDDDAVAIAGRVLPQDFDYLFVQQWRQARRLGRRDYLRLREKISGQIDLRFTAINAVYVPWIRVNAPIMMPSLTGKLINNRRSMMNVGLGTFQMTFMAMPTDIDDWVPATHEGTAPPIPFKPTIDEIPQPSIYRATAMASNGSVYFEIKIVNIARLDLFPVVRMRMAAVGATPAGEWIEQRYPDATASGGYFTVNTPNVPNDGLIDIQAAWIGANGAYGEWSAIVQRLAISDPVAPGALGSVSAVNSNGGANLGFTTPASSNISKVVVYRNQTGVFNSADKVQEIAVLPATVYTNQLDGAAIANVFTNADFAASGAGWTFGASWAWSAGKMLHTPGASAGLNQSPAMSVGQVWRVAATVSGRTAGDVNVRLFNGTSVDGAAFSSNGSFAARLTAVTGNNAVGFRNANAAFDGAIDDAVAFVETVDCIPQGLTYYWLEAQNGSGIAGPRSGPIALNIV